MVGTHRMTGRGEGDGFALSGDSREGTFLRRVG